MKSVEKTRADIDICNRALSELVAAIIEYDQSGADQDRQRFLGRQISVGGTAGVDRMRLYALTTDPVRTALREGLKQIGREICRLGGGTDAMLASLGKVARMDPKHAVRRGALIEAAWDDCGK